LGRHRLTWLDVFSAAPLQGNQLAVVHGADELDEATMLAFTRETKLSEAAFVQAPSAEGADYRNRIFDPAKELPFAGHPSLEPARHGPELDPDEILGAVGLTRADADPALPVQVVGTGVPQVLAPVRGESLARARPDYDLIEPLLDAHEAIVLYLAACDPAAGRARARAFGHTRAMGEDPATGSAAGPLMAHLHARAGTERLEIEQGVEMGRPSRLECAIEDGRVRLGGATTILIEGTVAL
jgi:trans-2,3-dihydro-3-hydroxyanthranilate isomerase